MILDLKSIFINEGESQELKTEFDFSEVEVFGLHPLQSPVQVSGRVFNRAGVVTLSLTCSAVYAAPCDRCSEPAEEPLQLQISRTLVSRLENEEDEEFILLPDMVLDLRALCYTEVVLRLPTKHLCKADCKGLCEKCGANLNKGECGCPKKEIDPRLEALKTLLD
ncbi:MAG: DUF177 domain-containing protein [Clostridia bacterium]|nr:DUF177 domain-containing protein [Clostridia bacterium]